MEETVSRRDGGEVCGSVSKAATGDDTRGAGARERDRGTAQRRPQSCCGAWLQCEPPARVACGVGGSGMIVLPSLRTLDGAQATRIWLASEAADMRCGFDRLAERVKAV